MENKIRKEIRKQTPADNFNLGEWSYSDSLEHISNDPNIWIPTIDHLYQYVQNAEFDTNGLHVIRKDGMQESIHGKKQFYLKSSDDMMIDVYSRNAYSGICYNMFSFTFSLSLIGEKLSGMTIISLDKEIFTLDNKMELLDVVKYFSELGDPLVSDFFGYIYPIIYEEIN